ncbi:pollen-specific leucine-rich repeat extensin-like protein 4 isoform X2 [Eurytemora carolleeae]|uniref:pollen-specific leucine-rich repeat extensin-like protein 4 isoform X2 n=1 Tax=Eurytemora carolleeae TaxID=1294199 RepID=UPI000C762941|nr:pollen-specific leucine-rich repeat extensin-like protein 4 isoform X2 [Eurytemora carolleeae]|eukprot:XP_023343820.1 pollen-specific leucine-rich repeat extensin-like protein 4 isoform X2 [Eurytemora affinis]
MFRAVPGPTSSVFEVAPGPKSPVFQVVPGPTSPVFQVDPGPTSPVFQVVPGPKSPVFQVVPGHSSRPPNYENVDLFKNSDDPFGEDFEAALLQGINARVKKTSVSSVDSSTPSTTPQLPATPSQGFPAQYTESPPIPIKKCSRSHSRVSRFDKILRKLIFLKINFFFKIQNFSLFKFI